MSPQDLHAEEPRDGASFLQIQHSDRKYSLYQAYAPVRWVDEINAWCVIDPGIIATILKSITFSVVDYAGHFAALAQRTGTDFAPSLVALNHIPLAHKGPRHAALREEMGRLIARPTSSSEQTVQERIDAIVHAACRPSRIVDLVEHIAVPIYDVASERILGVSLEAESSPAGSASQIFDRSLSLNRRKCVNADVARLAESLEARREHLATYPELAVALTILGRDALVGSITLSLWHVLSENDGVPLCSMAFPDDMPRTGIPYLERVALEEFRSDDLVIARGDRVRLYLDATTSTAEGRKVDLLFGKGWHSCLGKPLATSLWYALGQAMSRLPYRARLHVMRLRPHDYVFTYPLEAMVEFHE